MKRKSPRSPLITVASAAATAAALHWTALTFKVGGPLVFQAIAVIAVVMAVGLASGAILRSTR